MKATIYAIHADTIRRMDWTPLRERMPGRMAKADRYRLERDRLLCMGAGLLMLRFAGIRDESQLRQGKNGKPFAPGYPAFNLSHSGQWCVLAMGEGEIGVDIERIDPKNLEVAPTVYTSGELEWMSGSPLERFHTLWTWKESVMKATGQGMALEPGSFEVLPFAAGKPIEVDGKRLFAASGALEGYRYSVCAARPIDRLEWAEWKGDGL